MTDRESLRADRTRRTLSWGVHLFTASGAVFGVFALICIAMQDLDRAALLMLVALVIDSADGTLARAARVSDIVPEIDGRRLDDIVDFLNFAIVPVVFIWAAGGVTHAAWLTFPILASGYGFSRIDAKTEDDFFLGFPSYWNILAFYLWLLGIGPVGGTIWVTVLSIAVFVPFKYIYPSKILPMSLRVALGVGAVAWAAALVIAIVWKEEASRYFVIEASLAYPLWYVALSLRRGGFVRGTKPIAP